MCGICGFIEQTRTPLHISQEEILPPSGSASTQDQILEHMMATLVHRGPDQGQTWTSRHAALGFRRLSIIDIESGMQPLTNETGDKVLVFNGEIYNYQELRRELTAAGHRFSTQGDSEVLIHGYEEWGEHLTNHLRGMFAFAIWDETSRQIYAARDFFGIKPFYYALINGTFVFASEIKSILAYPGYEKKLNEEALEQYLSFQYSVLDETFFQGIYQLRPGHFLKFRQDTVVLELRRYFTPELTPQLSHAPDKDADAESLCREALKEQLDNAIQESVHTHMIADVEVGTFLSGGVDSSLIAAEFTGDKSFTVGFGSDPSRYNEVPLAQELSEELGLEHNGKRISEREFWDAVPEVLYYMDEPFGDPSAVALYFVSREAARKVRVVVSGEGSDEFFGGYRIYCEPNALRGYQKLPLSLRKALATLASHLPNMKGRSFLIRGSKTVEERYIGNVNLFTEKERKRLLKIRTRALSPQKLLEEDYRDSRHLDDASRMQYIDLLHWLPGDILRKADRMSMAHSLEVRVPYLDRKVFEAARSLPSVCKQKGQVSKELFRQVAARHLPWDTSQRKKLGFPVPLGAFLGSAMGKEKLAEAFSSPAAKKYFQPEALKELLDGKGCGQGRTNYKIWTIYAFLTWYKIYFPEDLKAEISL